MLMGSQNSNPTHWHTLPSAKLVAATWLRWTFHREAAEKFDRLTRAKDAEPFFRRSVMTLVGYEWLSRDAIVTSTRLDRVRLAQDCVPMLIELHLFRTHCLLPQCRLAFEPTSVDQTSSRTGGSMPGPSEVFPSQGGCSSERCPKQIAGRIISALDVLDHLCVCRSIRAYDHLCVFFGS